MERVCARNYHLAQASRKRSVKRVCVKEVGSIEGTYVIPFCTIDEDNRMRVQLEQYRLSRQDQAYRD